MFGLPSGHAPEMRMIRRPGSVASLWDMTTARTRLAASGLLAGPPPPGDGLRRVGGSRRSLDSVGLCYQRSGGVQHLQHILALGPDWHGQMDEGGAVTLVGLCVHPLGSCQRRIAAAPHLSDLTG